MIKYIPVFAALFAWSPTQAFASDASCEIIEAAINYHFRIENGTGFCGTNSATQEKLCLSKPSESYFLGSETGTLNIPESFGSSPPNLSPAIELTMSVKDQLKSNSRDVSMSRLVLLRRTKIDEAEAENGRFKDLLVGTMTSDIIGNSYQQRIKRLTRRFGPADPKVTDLENRLALHVAEREKALAKTTPVLEDEVSYANDRNYDLLYKQLQAHADLETDADLAVKGWSDLNWLESFACTNRLQPNNSMVVARNDVRTIVQTGKPLSGLRNLHPKTFWPRSLAITPNGDYAFISVYGHKGGSSYNLGRTLPLYVLKKADEGWKVIGSSAPTPVFY